MTPSSTSGSSKTKKMKASANIGDYVTRLKIVTNEIKRNGESLDDVRIMKKLLRSLTRKFDCVVTSIEESKDLCTITIDELVGSLHAHEQRMNQYDERSIWKRHCTTKCPSVKIQAIAVFHVAEVAIEVATEMAEYVEGSHSTEARILKFINHLVVVKILEVEEEADFNNEVTNLNFNVIIVINFVTSVMSV